MGPWILQNLIGVFWGYKPTANGPSGSAEHNRGVLGLQIHRQWALMFRRTQSGFLGLQIPRQWALIFCQTQSGVLGLQIHRQWALMFRRTQSGVLGYKSPPMGPWVPPNPIGVFWGYKSTANGPSYSVEHNRGVLGLQIPRQWALGFCKT
ncbi:Hypothetical protein FKW44_020125 [Caligus rogercresseyi]|uniref:Uncharacterized protein n=1 Tax=Caligus rogercresseyi TaxID=217165 RepID=A0A7T8GX42_CALRO|nr:Hypothetical protein FKW44_020125 [Caligus rogercresseyi]